MGTREDERTQALLKLVREAYTPAQVVIFIDPAKPPESLAKLNDTFKALLDVEEDVPSVRICEGGVCGLPVTDLVEVRRALGR